MKFLGAINDNKDLTTKEYVDTQDAVHSNYVLEQNIKGKQEFWRGTKKEYDLIATKKPEIMYIVTDDTSGDLVFAPIKHKNNHAIGGGDALSTADIGAVAIDNYNNTVNELRTSLSNKINKSQFTVVDNVLYYNWEV